MMSVSLLEPEPPRRLSPWPMRIAAAAAVLAVTGVILYSQFRYYGERKAVERFMEALQAGDYQTAYQLWKPTPTYTYKDFLEDWGETTPFGRVRSYEIVAVGPPERVEVAVPGRPTISVADVGQSGVIVKVRINGQLEPVRIWVEKKDKSLGFPPF